MAIEFNGKKVNNFRLGNELPKSKEVQKEEKAVEEKKIADNKFVKELGDDLLTSVRPYEVRISQGISIDKSFWGDALKGLKLKETSLTKSTEKGIAELGNVFAAMDMEDKMAKSPFMKALNKEFDL